MNYNVSISDDAENDLDESFIWYEIQRVGLGGLFFKSVNQSITIILKNPRAFQKVYKNIRKILTEKFPYCIYYYINENEKLIKIIAIIHSRRSPVVWKSRT
ncbi:MAG TPA: type II toxin-antitoxin system RelE/ParE family toxin [bacterium]|nr:type II toxin-antitoxin system RelE/ParE family toxin [bacterium]